MLKSAADIYFCTAADIYFLALENIQWLKLSIYYAFVKIP